MMYFYVGSVLYSIDTHTGVTTRIGDSGISVHAAASTSRAIYVATLASAGTRSLYRVNLKTAELDLAAILPNVIDDAQGLAWVPPNFVAINGADRTVHLVTPDVSVNNRELFFLPSNFRRVWTWDSSEQTPFDSQYGWRQEGTMHVRYTASINPITGGVASVGSPEFVYARETPLEETSELFRQLLRVKLARRLSVRFGSEPFLMREMRSEEAMLMREVQEVFLAQRGEPDEIPTNEVGRFEGVSFYYDRFDRRVGSGRHFGIRQLPKRSPACPRGTAAAARVPHWSAPAAFPCQSAIPQPPGSRTAAATVANRSRWRWRPPGQPAQRRW